MTTNAKSLLFVCVLASIRYGITQREGHFLYPDEDCQTVQAFQSGRNYYYTYDGTIIHTDATPDQKKSGFYAKCGRVVISVLSPCAARMKVEGCMMYDGQRQEDGSITFTEISRRTGKFRHFMHRFPLYFYFNHGEITEVFIHKNEPSDVANMKKSILSAISLNFIGQGFKQNMDQTFRISGTSIFGVGNSYASITTKTKSAMNITTRRYLFEHRLPTTQYDNSFLHVSGIEDNEESSFLRLLAHVMHKLMYDNIGESSPTQMCEYYVKRGRRVSDVTCSEMHTLPLFSKILSSEHIQAAKNFMGTNVTLHLGLYRISSLKSSDRMDTDEYNTFSTSHVKDTLMFRSSLKTFDENSWSDFQALPAFLYLFEGPVTNTAPVFSKLTLWLQNQDEAVINNLWYSIISSFTANPQQIPKAMSLWIQLLNECMEPKWCYHGECMRTTGCQTAFSSLLSTSQLENMERSIQLYLLDKLSSIKRPTSAVVQTALYFATTNSNPTTILTLGKVLNRHFSIVADEQSSDVITEVREFLRDVVEQKCSLAHESEDLKKTVMHAVNSLAPHVRHDELILPILFSCMQEISVPVDVLSATVQAVNNNHSASLINVRRQLFHLLQNRHQNSQVRLASFLVLLIHEPNNKEIGSMVEMLDDTDEVAGIKYFMREFIKAQIMLSETDYSVISKRTAMKIIEAMSADGDDRDQSFNRFKPKNQNFDFKRRIHFPFLNQAVDGFLKGSLHFLGQNPAPFMMEFSLTMQIHNVNISVVDLKVDVGRITSVLAPLIGRSGILPLDFVKYLINIPLFHWFDPTSVSSPPLPNLNLKEMDVIIDQFRLAQAVLDVQKEPILKVKLFGKESSSIISKSPFMKDLTIKKIMKTLEKLEAGINFNETLLNMPGYFRSEVPTSIGLPLITNAEITSLFKPAFRVMVEFYKLCFTGFGTVALHFGPAVQLHVNVERSMTLPRGKACGSGILLRVGHDSNVGMESRATPSDIKTTVQFAKKNLIFGFQVNSLAAAASTPVGFQITSDQLRCRKSMINAFDDIQLYTTACGEQIAPYESGLWLETNGKPIEFETQWGFMPMMREVLVPSVGIETTISKYGTLYEETPKFTTIRANYFPLQNEIEIAWVDNKRPTPTWSINANFLTSHQGVFTSFNMSERGFPYFTNTLNFQRASKTSALQDKLNALSLQDIFKHGLGPGYDVTGELNLIRSRFRAYVIGHVPAPTESGEYTAFAKVLTEPNATSPAICTIVYERENVLEDGEEGVKVEITLSMFTRLFIPYETTRLSNTMFDLESGYRKILRFETILAEDISGPFLDLRQSTKFGSADDRSSYDWNATITTNRMQGQWRTDSTDSETLLIKSQLVIPERPIEVWFVRPAAYEEMQISVDGPGVKVYGVDVVMGSTPESHTNTTVFYTANQFRNYIHFMQTQISCDYCVALEFHTQLMTGSLAFKLRPDVLKKVIFFSMLPEVASSFGLPVEWLSTHDNGLVKVGYSAHVRISSGKIILLGNSQLGNYICDVNGGLVWDPEDPISLNQHYLSNITLSCRKEVTASSSISDLNLSLGLAYNFDNLNDEARLRMVYDQYVQKGELMDFGETFKVEINKDNEDLIKHASISRRSSYSLAESETNDAISNKHAFSNVTLYTHEELPPDNLLPLPAYHVSAKGRIPSLLISPGGGELVYNYTGIYYLKKSSNSDEHFDDVCHSMERCMQRYENVMEANVKESTDTLVRLVDYVAQEHQSFVQAPWKQLAKMTRSSSYVEMSPNPINIWIFKDVGTVLLDKLSDVVRKYQNNSDVGLFENIVSKDGLITMQRYYEELAAMNEQRRIDLVPTRIYVESLFRGIYEADLALGAILKNPSTLSHFVGKLKDLFTDLASPMKWMFIEEDLYRKVTFAYPDMTQFISFNHQHHVIPSIGDERCAWLTMIDTAEKSFSVTYKRKSAVVEFLDETFAIQYVNGSFVKNEENIEFPFGSETYRCTKVTDNEVECSNAFMRMKQVFDPQSELSFTYFQVWASRATENFEGIVGIVANESAVLPRLLPDGGNADNEAEFLNAYEMSKAVSCRCSSEDIENLPENDGGLKLCQKSFTPYNHFASFRNEMELFVKACSRKAATQQDTCIYTNMFVESLRGRGISVPRHSSCSRCPPDEVVSTTINKANIVVMISLSSDMAASEDKALLIQLLNSSLLELSENGVENPVATLLSYGGSLISYRPAINTVKGSVTSSNIDHIASVVNKLQFDGPPYDPLSSVEAIRYATKKLGNSYLGETTAVVLMAPESPSKNIGGKISSAISEDFANNLMKLFVYSRMSEEECTASYMFLPPGMLGACYNNGMSDFSEAITEDIQEKLNHSAECYCTEDGLSGEIKSRCSVN